MITQDTKSNCDIKMTVPMENGRRFISAYYQNVQDLSMVQDEEILCVAVLSSVQDGESFHRTVVIDLYSIAYVERVVAS